MDDVDRIAAGLAESNDADMGQRERDLHGEGYSRIAGVDESGVGALAGPLVAAAAILPVGFNAIGIEDVKQLTRKQRVDAYEHIVTGGVVFSVCWADAKTIDDEGIRRCNLRLFREAVGGLDPPPDYVLIDGSNPVPGTGFPCETIVKGDATSACIAAASIVAKVTRDRLMDAIHQRFPEFGFDRNRAYGTPAHYEALGRLGPTAEHRLSIPRVRRSALPSAERSRASRPMSQMRSVDPAVPSREPWQASERGVAVDPLS